MPYHIPGLHHVTAMASDAASNVRFYRDRLGLRLVKQTINYDDPTMLHLYYGDDTGSPGSIVTFFIIPGLPRGSTGLTQVDGVSLALPTPPDARTDADGMPLHLTTIDGKPRLAPHTMHVRHVEQSKAFAAKWLGDGFESFLKIESTESRGRPGAATVHHIAFRIETEEEQIELHKKLLEAGVHASPIMDRNYFKSIYFREPGGVLYEVATAGPGFAVDEPVETLGQRLCLPSGLEKHRAEIESGLPRIM